VQPRKGARGKDREKIPEQRITGITWIAHRKETHRPCGREPHKMVAKTDELKFAHQRKILRMENRRGEGGKGDGGMLKRHPQPEEGHRLSIP